MRLLDADILVKKYPELYHMAEDGSWTNIAKLGLLSTTALMDHCRVEEKIREKIELCWRSKTESINCGELGYIKIRDQIPMRPEELEKCLKSPMTTRDWYKLINGRVFFWASLDDLKTLLSAKYYVNKPHIVIKVRTQDLLDRYEKKIRLSQINSGSVYYNYKMSSGAKPRDKSTFKTIKEYTAAWVKEVTVDYAVPDILDVTNSAEKWIAHRQEYEPATFEVLSTLWPT